MNTTEENTVEMVCEKHGKYMSKQVYSELLRRYISCCCPACCDEAEKEEAELEKRREQERRKKHYETMGVTPRFENAGFDTYIPQNAEQNNILDLCMTYADSFSEKIRTGQSIFLCGSVGTGKTHMAISAVKKIGEKYKTRYITTLQMIRYIRDSYRRDCEYSEQQAINKFIDYDFLAIDELGVQLGTESEKILLFEVIDGRYQQCRPTMLISNLNIKDLTTYLGERALDRLRENGGSVINMVWDSYRKGNK